MQCVPRDGGWGGDGVLCLWAENPDGSIGSTVHAPSTPRASRAGQHEAPIATVHDSPRRGLYTAQDTRCTRGTRAGPFLRDRSGIVTGDDGWVRPLRGLRDSATERAAEECDSVRGYSAGVCALDVVSECGHFVSFLMPSDSAVRNNVSTVTTTCRMRSTRTDVRAHTHARARTHTRARARTRTHTHAHLHACTRTRAQSIHCTRQHPMPNARTHPSAAPGLHGTEPQAPAEKAAPTDGRDVVRVRRLRWHHRPLWPALPLGPSLGD